MENVSTMHINEEIEINDSGYQRNIPLILGSGVSAPKNYIGLWPVVYAALENGINGFDTAPSYQTEEELGRVIKDAIHVLGKNREDIFIQTKIDAWQMMDGRIDFYVDDARRKLGIDYIDSVLIHWPIPEKVEDVWKALARLKEEGIIKKIGICNVRMRQLSAMDCYDVVVPDIVQIERNPLRTCEKEVIYCLNRNIQIQAYSPLCKMHPLLRESNVIKVLSEKYNKTVGQIILRWHIDTGVVPIFATTKENRVKEYSEIFGFQLSREEIISISLLNQNHKMYLESCACPGF